MAQNKTTENTQNVNDFLNQITDSIKRADSFRLLDMMKEGTGYEAKMWGPSIIGFGSYHYQYASGHEGDAPLAGFSPRAKEFSLYLAQSFTGKQTLLDNLGKHRAGVGCIYIKRLSDIDESILRKMINSSVVYLKEKYPLSK